MYYGYQMLILWTNGTKEDRKMDNDHLYKIFARRLTQLRKSKGLTQVQLAEKLGTSRSNIANYEAGVSVEPRDSMKRAIADYFGVTIDYLLGHSDDPSPKLTQEKVMDFRAQLDRYREMLDKGGKIPYDNVELTQKHLDKIQRFIEGYLIDEEDGE